MWDGISGRGVIDHVEMCHGNKLAEGEVRVLLIQCLPNSFHPVHHMPMEKAGRLFQLHISSAEDNYAAC